MATTTGTTSTTTLGSLIRTEQMSKIILDPNVAPSVHSLVAWTEDASMGHSEKYRFNRLDEPTVTFTEASPKTEADTAGFGNADAINSTGSDADAAVVGVKRLLSYEAAQDAGFTAEQVVRNNLIGLRKRITTDLLLNLVGHTNSSDFSGLALDLTRWGTALAAFGAQNPTETELGIAAILHDDQYRDLSAALRSSSGAIEATGRGLSLLKPLPGFKGYLEGVAIIVTGLVGAPDGSNWSGGLVTMGTMGALGLAVWNQGNTTKGYSVNGILNEMDRDIDVQGDVIVTSARYGTCITSPANARELISQT